MTAITRAEMNGIIQRSRALSAVACGVIATIAWRSAGVPTVRVAAAHQEYTVGEEYTVGARTIQIAQFAFSPAGVTVALGDTVRWLNRDPFIHTTAADSGAWNSGDVRPGGIFVLVADRTGRFTYHCGAHPTMHGLLVVDTARPPP